MKLFKEEKQDFPAGRTKLFLFLILFTSVNFSQIPINGFCRYNSLAVDSGFTSLFQLNFNNDTYSDLVLFNPGNKEIAVLRGEKNGAFSKARKYTSPVHLTNIENIINKKNIVTGYFYTSRKELTAGNISFSETGRPSGGKKIKLSSYPDFINVKDIDGNDTSECLISGSAYNGISVIYDKDGRLEVKEAVPNGIYARAYFTDISNDGFQDIAAQNIISNSIDLFYYNPAGNFYKVRSFDFEEKITSFRMNDIDLDGYDDIILTAGKSIKIYFGDFTSSFSYDLSIPADYRPGTFLTADYNKDGYIDIAYIDKREGLLSIFFASGSRSFYKEILYLKKQDMENIIPYYSRFINGIMALSSSGYLYSLTNLSSIPDFINLTAGVLPSVLRYFDFGNDGIVDYAFIDKYDHKLKIIIRNKEGIPSTFYSYPLFENDEDFIIERIADHQKRFYCYTPGKKLIEILDTDLSRGSYRRSSIYAPGNIFDVKPERDEDNNPVLFIAFISDGKLGLSKVSRNEMKYEFKTTAGISGNIQDAWFGQDKSGYLYYWKRQNSSLNLARVTYNRMFDDIKLLGTVEAGNPCSVTGITGNFLNSERDYTLSFLECSGEIFTISASDSLFLSLPNKIPGSREISNRHQLFYGEIRFNGLKKLSCYDPEKGSVYNFNFIYNGRKIVVSDLVSASGVRSFFIKNMSFRKYHLVYTNSIENCITIIQL